MAIVEVIEIRADVKDAQVRIAQLEARIAQMGAKGGAAATTMSRDWEKGLNKIGKSIIGAQLAMRAMSTIVQGMSQGFSDAMAVRMPGAIEKFDTAWNKMWRGFADQALDMVPKLDGVSGWFDKNADKIGAFLLRSTGAIATLGMSEIGLSAQAVAGGKGPVGLGSTSALAGQPAIPDLATDEMIAKGRKDREALAAQRAANLRGNANTMYGLEQKISAGKSDVEMANLARLAEIQDKEAELRKQHADDVEAIEKDKNDRIFELQAAAGQLLVSSTLGALEDMIAGQKVSGMKFVAGLAKQFGQIVFTKGIGDIAMGLATSANPLTPGLGAAQVAAGKYEVAVGLGLMTGGAIVSGMARRGEGVGGGGGSFAGGGAGGGGSSGGAGGGGDKTVIINVSGAVTDAGVGVQIKKALDEASKQGLL